VEQVVADVVDGYVTRQGAERDYGVVLRQDLSVDEEATQRQRREMANAAD
jgi:N-methylhydantoinase B